MATKNFVPRADNEGGIGTTSKRWADVEYVKLGNHGNCLAFDGAVIASDITTTNLTATDVTGQAFTVAANETWVWTAWWKVGSSTAAGCKYAVNFPAAATVVCQVWGNLASTTAFTSDTITAAATLGVAFNTGGLTTAAQGAFMMFRGSIINGANAGTVQMQQAKVTAGTASVYAGSFLQAQRIA
jgi:hypothetical protein